MGPFTVFFFLSLLGGIKGFGGGLVCVCVNVLFCLMYFTFICYMDPTKVHLKGFVLRVNVSLCIVVFLISVASIISIY